MNFFADKTTSFFVCVAFQFETSKLKIVHIFPEFLIKFVGLFLLSSADNENGEVEFLNVSSHEVMSHRCHLLKKKPECIAFI